MKLSTTTTRIVRTVVTCAAVGLFVASCGGDDDDDSSSSTTEPAADVCADREALSSSVDALKDVDVSAEGTNGVEAALNDVKDDVAALGDSVDAELHPQVDAVQDDIDQLETAVGNINSDGAAQAASAVSDLASSAATLLSSLEEGCDS